MNGSTGKTQLMTFNSFRWAKKVGALMEERDWLDLELPRGEAGAASRSHQ